VLGCHCRRQAGCGYSVVDESIVRDGSFVRIYYMPTTVRCFMTLEYIERALGHVCGEQTTVRTAGKCGISGAPLMPDPRGVRILLWRRDHLADRQDEWVRVEGSLNFREILLPLLSANVDASVWRRQSGAVCL
jgi:hypothetical protein